MFPVVLSKLVSTYVILHVLIAHYVMRFQSLFCVFQQKNRLKPRLHVHYEVSRNTRCDVIYVNKVVKSFQSFSS